MDHETALELRHGGGLSPQTLGKLPALAHMSDEDFEFALTGMSRMRDRLRRVHLEVMKQDVDYGKIPGTDKPTLLKPGAELLLKMNRCAAKYERQRTSGDGVTAPAIAWDSTCYAVDGEGNVQAEGSGSCNSWERKYRWRNAERECPECGKRAIIKGSAQYGGGFVCWKKRDGCGVKFEDDDKRITEQMLGQVENPDPWDLDNTLKKMSDKRAMVACALTLQAASGSFTQDLVDDEDDAPVPKGVAKGKPRTDEPPPPTDRDAPTAAPRQGALLQISEAQARRISAIARETAEKHGQHGFRVVNSVLKSHDLELLPAKAKMDECLLHLCEHVPPDGYDQFVEACKEWTPEAA